MTELYQFMGRGTIPLKVESKLVNSEASFRSLAKHAHLSRGAGNAFQFVLFTHTLPFPPIASDMNGLSVEEGTSDHACSRL